MAIECPECGNISQDEEFCDACNSELARTTPSSVPVRCMLGPVSVEFTPEQHRQLAKDQGFVVVRVDSELRRIRWISREPNDAIFDEIERRRHLSLSTLPPIQIHEDREGCWVVAELVGQPFAPWDEPPGMNPILEFRRLVESIQSVSQAMDQLHQVRTVWLNFDPSELEDVGPLQSPGTAEPHHLRQLRITNLDQTTFPFGTLPNRLTIRPKFSAPEIVRYQANAIGPATDVFHLGLLTYYWIAGLMPLGFHGEGLESFDYQIPNLRIYVPHLPEGIIPIVMKAVEKDPNQRYETPAKFTAALAHAYAELGRRRSHGKPLTWNAAGDTRVGRTKTELGLRNEDYILVRSFPNPPCELLLVADGISSCQVGSGALASMMTAMVLENAFPEPVTHGEFVRKMAKVCKDAADVLLDWALVKGYRRQLLAGADLMGTTLTSAWIRDHEITIANLGDSRAYLITDDYVELLTVDGDVASGLLQNDAGPEEIVRLGPIVRALRECVGGCRVLENAELAPLEESRHPKLATWPLAPGDVFILCSDGLVEEGAFLHPKQLADLVRKNHHLPAKELASLLVEAADQMQRLPSFVEPEGWGDNISCIVVKIMEAAVPPSSN